MQCNVCGPGCLNELAVVNLKDGKIYWVGRTESCIPVNCELTYTAKRKN